MFRVITLFSNMKTESCVFLINVFYFGLKNQKTHSAIYMHIIYKQTHNMPYYLHKYKIYTRLTENKPAYLFVFICAKSAKKMIVER